MNLEELKNVDVTTLVTEKVKEHQDNVLTLEKDELHEYILYALDTYYKTEEEGENNESVELFFGDDRFKDIYRTLEELSDAE